ncbi:MAG: cystathionine beta-lyase [Paenalcaligenes sp.]
MGETGSSTQTILTQVGRGGESSLQYVNPPIVRGTTVLAKTLEQWRQRAKLPFNAKPQANYGRFGTLTTAAFESAMAELEGAYRSFCFPSGLAACTHSLLAVCKPGSHVLLTDFVYWPLREFAENVLTQLGVEVEFFSSLKTADVLSRFKENTCALYLEAPGSISFEMCEIDELAHAAHQRGAIVLMDNTWATPLLFKPLEHGVDISIQSVSKYIGGHSDCIMGVASCTEKAWDMLSNSVTRFGQTASPDDLYQALRGLRTLDVRLRQHGQSALSVARWLEQQPEVQRVCCPGLASHPGHATFKRLFRDVSGLFSFVFEPMPEEKLAVFFDSLRIIGIGLSWGGFESLVVPLVARPASQIHDDYLKEGQLVRIHVGLENIEDLTNDLQQAFVQMRRYAA